MGVLLRPEDRERWVALLREHYATGTLDLDEFDRRVGIVLAARTSDDLGGAVADLPGLGSLPAATSPGPAHHRGRHAQSGTVAAGWMPTAERFRDPSSGHIMRVWIDPADGSRHYVVDDQTP